jgi:D-cysteine desulfhydrase family pyridoxal phosphate-dependent enzyme
MTAARSLSDKLGAFPRASLAHLPTPLESLSTLSRELAPLTLHVKRDDQTGLAFGGNKARKLEFIVGDAVERGADTLVTWAGVQSNWCRQLSAAAAAVGLRAVLVLLRKAGEPAEEDGNLLLDRILGADVRIVDASSAEGFLELTHVRQWVEPVLEEEREAGRVPYLAPIGGSLLEGSMRHPAGALGYVAAFSELLEQSRGRGFTPDVVALATGSAGTQAGLLAGAKLLSPKTRIIGLSVAAPRADATRYVRRITEATLDALGEPARVSDDEVEVLDDYLGDGYGVVYPAVTETIRRVAGSEGLLLDPVYTGKAMVGLFDLAGRGSLGSDGHVVFLHTGGTPALFPYRNDLLAILR